MTREYARAAVCELATFLRWHWEHCAGMTVPFTRDTDPALLDAFDAVVVWTPTPKCLRCGGGARVPAFQDWSRERT